MHTYMNVGGCLLEDKTFNRRYVDIFLKGYNPIQQLNKIMDFANFIHIEVEASLRAEKVYDFDLCILDETFFSSFLHILPYKFDVTEASFLFVFDPLSAGVPAQLSM